MWPLPTQHHLSPYACAANQDCTNTKLFHNTAWKSITCKASHCRVSRSSAKWLCECNKPWYTCEVHASLGHKAGHGNGDANTNQPRKHTSSTHGPPPIAKRRMLRGSASANTCKHTIHNYDPSSAEQPCKKSRQRKDHNHNNSICTNLPVRRIPKRKAPQGDFSRTAKRTAKADNEQAKAAIARLRIARIQAIDPGSGVGSNL